MDMKRFFLYAISIAALALAGWRWRRRWNGRHDDGLMKRRQKRGDSHAATQW